MDDPSQPLAGRLPGPSIGDPRSSRFQGFMFVVAGVALSTSREDALFVDYLAGPGGFGNRNSWGTNQ